MNGVPETKLCTKCMKYKPYSEFYLSKECRWSSWCKECQYEDSRKRIGPYRATSKNERTHKWTDAQVDALKALYPTKTGLELSAELGLSTNAIYAKAKELGLKKYTHREY